MSWNLFKQKAADFFTTSGVDVIRGLFLFLVGFLVIKLVLKFTNRVLTKGKVEKSVRKFLYNVIRYVLYFLLIMIILSSFNVSITGFIAVLSALGLALSLALQNSLSNLANGVIIIISKPFKQGDAVKIGNIEGVISEIGMTHTILTSYDNRKISVPNKMIVESVVVNSSVLDKRKVSFEFIVSYKTDIDKVRNIILNVFGATNYVLTNPAPFVGMDALEERGIKIVASAYCETKDYSKVYYPVLEEIFNEFKKNNIILPYAQLEVKLKDEKEVLPISKTTKLLQKPIKDVEDKITTKTELGGKTEQMLDEEDNGSEDEPTDYVDYLDKVNVIEEIEVNIDEEDETESLTDVEELEKLQKSFDENSSSKNKKSFFSKLKPKEKDKKQKVIIKKTK